MRPSQSRSLILTLTLVAACGGDQSHLSRSPGDPSVSDERPTPQEIAQAEKQCGESDRVHAHDLASGEATEAFAPCANGGARDYSALVRMVTLEQGVHILIDATDDEVTLLGPDVKERDAVIVYPKGKGSPGVEVALVKTKTGYRGDKIVLWDDLGALTDEGSRVDVAIYDHDKSSRSTEEMHVSLVVSAGKSCEKALDENMEKLDLRAKQGGAPDLTKEELGAPMRTSSFFSRCGLPDSSNADVCVAIKRGRPVGVSVAVTPPSNRVAACIDRSARRLSFPVSEHLDVVHQKF
jgi:hypothetical protein